MKVTLCLIYGGFLCCFAAAVFGSSESESDPSKSVKTNEKSVENLQDLFNYVKTLEVRIQELEKSHEECQSLIMSSNKSQEELKEQVKSLKNEVDELKEQMREDHGLWLLTSPLRGPPGKDGKPGPKGERGLSAPQTISSCSVAMEALPSPLSKKQRIYPHGNSTSLEVLCDFETDGGGWTIIQKRTSGPKQEFQKNWIEYKNGFGSLQGNFWLGLDNIHALTKNGDQELRIELEDFEGEKRWVQYSSFSISDASVYRLSLNGFYSNSTAGNSMTLGEFSENGSKFSTKDKVTDNSGCMKSYAGGGGWWNNACGYCNLNGLYFEKGETVPYAQGIRWYTWNGHSNSFAKSEMKIRPRK